MGRQNDLDCILQQPAWTRNYGSLHRLKTVLQQWRCPRTSQSLQKKDTVAIFACCCPTTVIYIHPILWSFMNVAVRSAMVAPNPHRQVRLVFSQCDVEANLRNHSRTRRLWSTMSQDIWVMPSVSVALETAWCGKPFLEAARNRKRTQHALSRVQRNDGWWRLLCTQAMVIACRGHGAAHQLVVLTQASDVLNWTVDNCWTAQVISSLHPMKLINSLNSHCAPGLFQEHLEDSVFRRGLWGADTFDSK